MVDFSKHLRKAKPTEKKAIKKKNTPQPQIDPETGFPVSNARHITEFPELVDVIPELALESVQLAAKMKVMEARRKEIGSEIAALLEAVGHNSITGDGFTAVRSFIGGKSAIDAAKLLEQGVELEVIENATDVGEGYWQTSVAAPRKKKGE